MFSQQVRRHLCFTGRVPPSTRERAGFVESAYDAAVRGRQDRAVRPEHFQSVPGRGVVTGGDLDAAGRVQPPDREATGGSGGDADVLNHDADFKESGKDRMA